MSQERLGDKPIFHCQVGKIFIKKNKSIQKKETQIHIGSCVQKYKFMKGKIKYFKTPPAPPPSPPPPQPQDLKPELESP